MKRKVSGKNTASERLVKDTRRKTLCEPKLKLRS